MYIVCLSYCETYVHECSCMRNIYDNVGPKADEVKCSCLSCIVSIYMMFHV